MGDDRSNPMIFLVGCPRSGTTLLRDLLRSHSRLTFPPETRFIPSYYRAYGDPADDREAQRLARMILRFPWIRRWIPDLTPAAFASCRSYRGVVDQLFREWATRERKPRWGDKTPGYVLEIPTLIEIFPDARFLHLIRDGRDVALSFFKAPFGPINIYGAAEYWARFVSAGRRAAINLPSGSYMETTYEALVTEPEPALRRICEFIDEPFDLGMLSPKRLGGDGKGKIPPVSQDSIVTDQVERWKHMMSPSDVALFESVGGDLLVELGYQATRVSCSVGYAKRLYWRTEDRASRSLNVLRNRKHFKDYALLRWGRIRQRLRSRGWIS
ncbi:MAG: sulfotransferase family protein [Gemmatimonadota bacterium]